VRLWIDEQLSPALADWLGTQFDLDAASVRSLGLARATDEAVFRAARSAEAIVVTKDQDFVRLLAAHGPPPRVLWITLGNTSNRRLQAVLSSHLRPALELFRTGEALVEIRDAASPRRAPQ
jgi:predicted nuclease of predicted toxin-antitoxin system